MSRTQEHYQQHIGKSVRLLADDCFPELVGEVGEVIEMYDTDIFNVVGRPSLPIVQVQFGEEYVIACTPGQLAEIRGAGGRED